MLHALTFIFLILTHSFDVPFEMTKFEFFWRMSPHDAESFIFF